MLVVVLTRGGGVASPCSLAGCARATALPLRAPRAAAHPPAHCRGRGDTGHNPRVRGWVVSRIISQYFQLCAPYVIESMSWCAVQQATRALNHQTSLVCCFCLDFKNTALVKLNDQLLKKITSEEAMYMFGLSLNQLWKFKSSMTAADKVRGHKGRIGPTVTWEYIKILWHAHARLSYPYPMMIA